MPDVSARTPDYPETLQLLLQALAVSENAEKIMGLHTREVRAAWEALPEALRPADTDEAELLVLGLGLAEELKDTRALRDLERRLGRLLLSRGQWREALQHMDKGIGLVRAHYTEECMRISEKTARRFESELHEVREVQLAGRHRELAQLHRRISESTARLERAVADCRTLSRLLPICSSCRRVRDDQGFWSEVQDYVRQHSEADIQLDLCPECQQQNWEPPLEEDQEQDNE